MATLTIQPEHVDGLRYLLSSLLESHCDSYSGTAADREHMRALLDLGDALDRGEPAPNELRLPDALLEKIVEQARMAGNEHMAEIYLARSRGDEPPTADGSAEEFERAARSMIAVGEHFRTEGAAR